MIVPTGPFAIRARKPSEGEDATARAYDPQPPAAARPVFYAEGPDIRAGVRLQPFANTDIYPLVAAILGLQAPAVDGSLGPVSPALAH